MQSILTNSAKKTVIKKLIREAKKDVRFSSIHVHFDRDNEVLNETQKESDIVEAVFCGDPTFIDFYGIEEIRLGWAFIVDDFDMDPDEIINDYSDNDFMNGLIGGINES